MFNSQMFIRLHLITVQLSMLFSLPYQSDSFILLLRSIKRLRIDRFGKPRNEVRGQRRGRLLSRVSHDRRKP